jgi:hypothetical protein
MQHVKIEHALIQLLSSLPKQTVLCDADGNAIGMFSPLPESSPISSLQLEPTVSMAELEALRKNPTGKPLSEILSRLGFS